MPKSNWNAGPNDKDGRLGLTDRDAAGAWRMRSRYGANYPKNRTDEALAMLTLLGGIGTIVVIHIWQAFLVGLIAQASLFDAGTDVRPILAVVTGIDQSVTLPLAIMMGAAGVAILVGRALPRWLGWLAILTSAAAIVGVLAIVVVFADGGVGQIVAAANPIALLLFLIWVTGVSIMFARSSEPRT